MNVLPMLQLLRPPQPPVSTDPKEQAKYLRRLSHYHFTVTSIVTLLLLGAVWAMSPFGFARADMIDEKIKTALEPVQLKQLEVEGVVKKIDLVQQRDSTRLAVSLSNSVASDMRFLQSKICTSIDRQERERFQNEIDKKQVEFRDLRTYEYNVPACSQL